MWTQRFPRLARLRRNLLYGFRRELRPYEATILESILAASTEEDRAAIREQFEARERVQRWAERVLYFGLPPEHDLPAIEADAPEYCYAKVELASPAGEITAKLMTYRGFLSTLEFSTEPLPLLSGEFRVESVDLHPGGKGYTDEIHEEEHGPEIDD